MSMWKEDMFYAVERINKSLIGATITSALISEDDSSYGFIVNKNGQDMVVWVDCDPEGNGPGWLSFEDNDNG